MILSELCVFYFFVLAGMLSISGNCGVPTLSLFYLLSFERAQDFDENSLSRMVQR